MPQVIVPIPDDVAKNLKAIQSELNHEYLRAQNSLTNTIFGNFLKESKKLVAKELKTSATPATFDNAIVLLKALVGDRADKIEPIGFSNKILAEKGLETLLQTFVDMPTRNNRTGNPFIRKIAERLELNMPEMADHIQQAAKDSGFDIVLPTDEKGIVPKRGSTRGR